MYRTIISHTIANSFIKNSQVDNYGLVRIFSYVCYRISDGGGMLGGGEGGGGVEGGDARLGGEDV